MIIHVESTPAYEQDNLPFEKNHAALLETQLLPAQHVVDAGYVSRDNLVSSNQDYLIYFLAPIRSDNSWQARDKDAFNLMHFQIDLDEQNITYPIGRTSSNWGPGKGPRGKYTILVQLRKKDCCGFEAGNR